MNEKINNSNQLSHLRSRIFALLALFEEDFSIDWVVELTGEKASHLLIALEEGIQQGTLRRKTPGIFSFTGMEERRKWLDNLSREGKQGLLQRITALFLREPLNDDDKALLMAPYLLQLTNNEEENSRWLLRAGNAYRRAFRTEEALHCYAKVLDDLSTLHGQGMDTLFTEAAINYSKVSTGRHDTTKVLAVLQEALSRTKKWKQEANEALLKMHLAKNEWLLSNYFAALKYFQEGWSSIKDLKDSRLLRSATTFSTFFLFWQGRFQEAIQAYEMSVSDVEKYPEGRFPVLATMTLGRCYAHRGQVTQGLGMLDSMRTYCLEKGDQYLVSNAAVSIGTTMLDIRRMDDAIQYLERSVEESRKVHNNWVQILAKLALAYSYYLIGENERSIANLQEYLKDSSKVKVTMSSYPYLMEICWAMEEGKLPQIPGLSLDREIHQNIKGENVFVKGIAYRFLAIVQKQTGRPHNEITQSLELSLKWLEDSGDQIELAKSRLEFARFYSLLQNEEKAGEMLHKASKALYPLNPLLIPDDLKPLVKNSSSDQDLFKEILKVGKEVVTIRDNKDLVQHIISTVNRITGAERGAIFLFENNSHPPKLGLRASKNLTSDQINHPSFQASLEMIGEVAITGRGRIQEMNSSGTRSQICVPMILKDKVFGVLYHDNRLLSSAFKESDLELLAYFAAQAAFALDNAMAYEEIQRLNQKLREEKLYFEEAHFQNLHFDEIIGESPAIRKVLSQIDQVAKTEATVLVLGETGVGKELVARAIHLNSPRREKPFIRVFCSALPESLIPSELFGHEKGAFTGATQRRIGRFELADGGTLFLDEIGDLPLQVQVRLLRILQTKEFERVGSSQTIRSDFRLIAATNRDLDQMVKNQKFRSDLYYRINVFPITVPALRDRREDIPLLAQYFLKNYSIKMGKSFDGISESEVHRLIKYDWPGNVRELENIIERGIILNPGSHFRVPSLGTEQQEASHPKAGPSLKEMERHHILWALQKTEWRVRGQGGTAELLQIHPSTLAFRMKKLGIRRPQPLAPKIKEERIDKTRETAS